MLFLVFLVPLSILAVARRGKGSGGPEHDIRTRRSILYRIEAEKTKSIFHSNLALGAPYLTGDISPTKKIRQIYFL